MQKIEVIAGEHTAKEKSRVVAQPIPQVLQFLWWYGCMVFNSYLY
ncbi:hypothetical protein [Escherichia albertii]|nr:hypothetical protein [Escherichia albertii]MCZ7516745.1 hypothetical protein [Escherichia albertii]WDB48794.1 hypothetical protein PS038_05560 [Escherichia albertii]